MDKKIEKIKTFGKNINVDGVVDGSCLLSFNLLDRVIFTTKNSSKDENNILNSIYFPYEGDDFVLVSFYSLNSKCFKNEFISLYDFSDETLESIIEHNDSFEKEYTFCGTATVTINSVIVCAKNEIEAQRLAKEKVERYLTLYCDCDTQFNDLDNEITLSLQNVNDISLDDLD